jgi:hypothetical protein
MLNFKTIATFLIADHRFLYYSSTRLPIQGTTRAIIHAPVTFQFRLLHHVTTINLSLQVESTLNA